jgi:hypothetical protein
MIVSNNMLEKFLFLNSLLYELPWKPEKGMPVPKDFDSS